MKSRKNLFWMIGLLTAACGAQAVASKVTLHNDTNQPVWLVLNRADHKTLRGMEKAITPTELKKHNAKKIAARKGKTTFTLIASKEKVGRVIMPPMKKFYVYSKDSKGAITYHLSVLQKWRSQETKPTVFKMSTLKREAISGQFEVKYNRDGGHERIHSGVKKIRNSFTGWFRKALGK